MPVLNPVSRLDRTNDALAATAAQLQEAAHQRGTYLQVGEEHENSILPQGVPEVLSWRHSNLFYVLTFYGPLLKDPDFDVGGFFLAAYNAELDRYRSPHISHYENTTPAAYHTAIEHVKQTQRERVQDRLMTQPVNLADAAFAELVLLAENTLHRQRFMREIERFRALEDALENRGTGDALRDLIEGEIVEGENLHLPLVELFLDAFELMQGKDMQGLEVDLTPQGLGAYDGHPKEADFEHLLEHIPFHHRVIDAKLGSPEEPKLLEAFLEGTPQAAHAFANAWLFEKGITSEEQIARWELLTGDTVQPTPDMLDATAELAGQVETLFADFCEAKMADRYTLLDMLQHRATTSHRMTASHEEIDEALNHGPQDLAVHRTYGMDVAQMTDLYQTQAEAFMQTTGVHVPLLQNMTALDVHDHAMTLSRAFLAQYPQGLHDPALNQALIDDVLGPIRDVQLDAFDQWQPAEMAHWERLQHKPALLRLPADNVWDHPVGVREATANIDTAIQHLPQTYQQEVWQALHDEIIRFRDVRRILYGQSADLKGPKPERIEALLEEHGVVIDDALHEALREYVVHHAYTGRDLIAFRLQEETEKAYGIIREAYETLYNEPGLLDKLPERAVNNVQPEGTGREGGMIEMVLEILPPEIARLMERVKRMTLSGQWDDQMKLYGPKGEQVDLMPGLRDAMQLIGAEFPEQTTNLYTCGQVYASGTHGHLGPMLRDEQGFYTDNPCVTPALHEDGTAQLTSKGAHKQFISDFAQYYALALSKLGPGLRASMGNNVDDLVRNSIGLAAPKYFELLNLEADDPELYALVRMGSSMNFVQFEGNPHNGHLEDRAPGASSDPRLRNIYHLLTLQHATDNYIVDQLGAWSGQQITPANIHAIAEDYLQNASPEDMTMRQFMEHMPETRKDTLARIKDHLTHGLLIPGEFPAIQAAFAEDCPRGYRTDGGGPKIIWWFDIANGAEMGERGPRIVPEPERKALENALLNPGPETLIPAQTVIENRFAKFEELVSQHMAYQSRELGQQRSDLALKDVTIQQGQSASAYVQGVAAS